MAPKRKNPPAARRGKKTKAKPKPKKKPKLKKKVKLKKEKRENKLSFLEPEIHKTKIKVIGIGGGGGSIISEIAPNIDKVNFVAANTDLQALKSLPKKCQKFQFGQNITGGLGCGMDPQMGLRAAQEKKEKIAKLFNKVDLVVLVASLGGGTGSGSAPEFGKIAKEQGVLSFGIFTLPFKFEGSKKTQIAKSSLDKLTPLLNAVSVVPNERIFQLIDKKTPLKAAFSTINKILAENLRGLIEMIYLPGFINIDFADLKTVMEGKGKLAYLNSAEAEGPNRIDEISKKVLQSPLNEYSIQKAERILFNITASKNLGMKEVEQLSSAIAAFNPRAKIIFGVSQDQRYGDKVRVSLLAIGCGKKPKPKAKPPVSIKTEASPEASAKEDEPKPKVRVKIKPKKKNKKRRKPKKKSKPIPNLNNSDNPNNLNHPNTANLSRRNGLDIKKEQAQAEREIEETEKKWDIPAFLRKKTQLDEQP